MISREYGYMDNPANGLGIVRARTLIGNLRLWDIPRSEQALEMIIEEIGTSSIPGLYMLFDEHSGKKVYIGQSENLKSRLTNHIKSPEDKIKNWNRALIINDGRNAAQSDLNDENIRLVLEDYLVNLFKINRYKVVTSSSRTPSLSSTQKTLVRFFKEEIVILLTRKSKISKVLTERGDDEVYSDEVKRILKRKGYSIQNWKRYETMVNGIRAFIRTGSLKSVGWQVTVRGHQPTSFKSCFTMGEGYLLVPRGPILLIPLQKLRDFVSAIDNEAFTRDTVDIFFRFDEDKIVTVYKGEELEVTEFAI